MQRRTIVRKRNVTYPKDNEQKLRDTVHNLRAKVSRLRKENQSLRDELSNIIKPERSRKEHVEQPSQKKMTREEWRQDFIKRHKPHIEKRLREIKDE